jgi:hypothetical protein
MRGWKTWAGGIGMIVSGVGTLLMAFTGQADADLQSALSLITGGLAVIGLGHKIEKAAK